MAETILVADDETAITDLAAVIEPVLTSMARAATRNTRSWSRMCRNFRGSRSREISPS